MATPKPVKVKHVEVPGGVVIRGDILDLSLWKNQLRSRRFPLVIADPPYGKILKNKWDNWGYNEYLALGRIVCDHLTDGGSAYIWGGIGKKGHRPFFQFLSNIEGDQPELTVKNVITWSKKRAYGKQDDYLFTREEVAWLVRGDKPAVFNVPYLSVERGYEGYNKKYPAKSKYKRRTNVWTDITEILSGKKHEAEKPERLAEVMIETHTNPGDIVVDLFSGSGNVSVVAQRMKRKFIAIERDTKTFNKIVKRLK